MAIFAVFRIRDVYPGSNFFSSRIRTFPISDSGSASKCFNPKNWFLSPRKYDSGCSSRIRIQTFYPSRIQGSKRHRIQDPQHCIFEYRIYVECRYMYVTVPWNTVRDEYCKCSLLGTGYRADIFEIKDCIRLHANFTCQIRSRWQRDDFAIT
jgi:hypothetical protein